MKPVNIETLRGEEVQEAAKVAARALAPTPFPMAVFGGLDKTERGLEATIRIQFSSGPGQVLVARKNNRVVGVLRMVEWPQCQTPSGQAFKLLPILLKTLGTRVIRAMKGRAVWAKNDPKEPHWHIDPLAVIPEMQGQGIGSQLLQRFCALVDKTGKPAYLETDRPENVRLYQRFGFSVVHEVTPLGVPCYFMWRPAFHGESR